MIYIAEISSTNDASAMKNLDEEHGFNKLFLDTAYSVQVRDGFDVLNETKDIKKAKELLNGFELKEMLELFLKDAPKKELEFLPMGDNLSTMKRLLVRYGTNKKIKRSDRILFVIKEKNKPIIDFIENELRLPLTIL
ncbi:MAG: hypothetical protein ACFFCS_00100 [Candidatus Hodarchaeota archaeon]